MPVRVKGGGAKRWVDRASVAQESYIAGAENPREDWATATSNAEGNYNAGVQEAITKKSFSKGVKRAGSTSWLNGIRNKGAQRYASGVALAEQKYADGIQPYLDVIAGLNLPKRGKKGDPNNINRVAMVTKALHDKKLQLKG